MLLIVFMWNLYKCKCWLIIDVSKYCFELRILRKTLFYSKERESLEMCTGRE